MPGARLNSKTVLSHLGVMVAVSAVLGVLVAGLTIPFAGVAGLGARTAAESLDQLPAELEAEPLPERTRVLDSEGRLLATFYDENRVNIPLEDVAPIMKQAMIAIEDYRFYEHGALDLRGTLRAFLTNTASDDVVQGGSSITQQMVKLTLVAQAETAEERRAAIEETYERKFNELRYAVAFEEQYSKDWILERYLNLAYFGAGAYGVQAAARTYFSKPASKLNLRESAMLAGLVQNPSRFDPTNNREAARTRRDVVLNRMAQLGVVSDEDAQQALERPLGLKVSAARDGCISSAAPFFCDYARRYLLADQALGETKEERAQLLNTAGLTITTTIDLRMQRAADRATTEAVDATAQAIGALALVQPRTGAVKALSQSRPMGRDRKRGQSFLNYIVDSEFGDSNGFQAGSTFKVFTLASAIMQGVSLTTQIAAPETVSIPEREYRDCNGPYASTTVWEPSNSTGSGTFDLYTGTQQSVNTFFAQLLLRTGLCKPFKLARDMGVRLDSPATERVPSFTLGVADVSPLEMAGAYATFAARGVACQNRPIQEIRTASGELFKEYPRDCKRVMRKPVADAVNDILRGVMEGGFGSGFALDQPSAGKTGTTNSNRAVWFVGYTPNLSTAAMVAGANQQGQPSSLNGTVINGRTVFGAAGSTLAGPMWGRAMQAISQFLPDKDFVSPTQGVVQGDQKAVPSLGGLSVSEASRRLEQAGFFPRVGPSTNSSYPSGTVAFTSPGSGSQIGTGSTVTIYVSNGSPSPPPPPPPSDNDSGGDDGDGGDGGGGGGDGGGDGGGGGGNNGGGNGRGGGNNGGD
ncbi:MAG: transglycosylase domain-containing protein [Nocardioides sp.]|nr:transglycosylase domain-containing protein [Nocardioides sp.]